MPVNVSMLVAVIMLMPCFLYLPNLRKTETHREANSKVGGRAGIRTRDLHDANVAIIPG